MIERDYFGENLKRIRKRQGFTQLELADISGIHKQTISRYENGKKTPTLDCIVLLSCALGYDLLDYVKYDVNGIF